MKNIKIIIALSLIVSIMIGLGACEKAKKGQMMFYSDVFLVINCILDSVSLYVDDIYVGEIKRDTNGGGQIFTGEEIPIAIRCSEFMYDIINSCT